ncbi:MAG: Stp1/IreP family PP2C-type Ser/Thr phosphatase [Bacillota bacterium]
MKIGAMTDKGRIREQNEDAYGYKDHLFVIADGMGGHEAGEIASAIAVETILASEISPDLAGSLQAAVKKANNAILAEINQNETLDGMGTTVAVLWLDTDRAYVAHVGDSRIYQFHGGDLIQLTADHSLVAELVKNGSITEEEAKIHPQRNVLTRALGTKGELDLEINLFQVHQGDKFLLCSDGLTGMLDEAAIRNLMALPEDPQAIAGLMVAKANENGGSDNITVIVIEV